MVAVYPNNNLYEVIAQLCADNSLVRVNNLIITVQYSSRISEHAIREYFQENKSELVGEWTNITVEKRKIDNLKAIIQRVDGEHSR